METKKATPSLGVAKAKQVADYFFFSFVIEPLVASTSL